MKTLRWCCRTNLIAGIAVSLIGLMPAAVFAQPKEIEHPPTEQPPVTADPPTIAKPPEGPSIGAPAIRTEVTGDEWTSRAKGILGNWTTEKKAEGCGCSETHYVFGPTTMSVAQWKAAKGSYPKWDVSDHPLADHYYTEKSGGGFAGVPHISPMGKVTISRRGIVIISDFDVYTLELAIKCTSTAPNCPNPNHQSLKSTYQYAKPPPREMEILQACWLNLPDTSAAGGTLNVAEAVKEAKDKLGDGSNSPLGPSDQTYLHPPIESPAPPDGGIAMCGS